VQGVGFRPFVFRLAQANALVGWVLNGDDGVRIHVEGRERGIDAFLRELTASPPPAARVTAVDVVEHDPLALSSFEIRESVSARTPTTRISPDLPVCDQCVRELFDSTDPRFRYPYINCTNCGPRYSIIRALPYDRAQTTMADWQLCSHCAAEYGDPRNRRFHAQPVACAACGPTYSLVRTDAAANVETGLNAIRDASRLLREGRIVAIKGIGGYHVGCGAENAAAVAALRERKFRKEKPFALMVRDVEVARQTVWLSSAAEQLLCSSARPIVLCSAREDLPGVAPGMRDLGIMLPYAPLHHLLFASGAPDRLVMTSGNLSNEPIAYRDDEAVRNLGAIADAILVGERAIARRVDDSVARVGGCGPVILRRSRGYAPGVVAHIPSDRPILALGADLKNSITLLVNGETCMSQHVGDLEHYDAAVAFRETVDDLLGMYNVNRSDLVVAHDLHPEYRSTAHAMEMKARDVRPVQHHRAHIASVLAEREELDARVIGVAFDGTGYGDDGTIWGGEFFVGSLRDGFERVAHLRRALLPGGDAAARYPVQAAAGFLAGIEDIDDVVMAPFTLGPRYRSACALVASGLRSFATTSAGRLFDTAAALTGFTRAISYEGQAAIWLEHLARTSPASDCYPMPFDGAELDWRQALKAMIAARRAGADPADIARAFHMSVAQGIALTASTLAERYHVSDVVLSGGVFQNDLLLEMLVALLSDSRLRVLTNSSTPPNDGGISLGQAAIAALQPEQRFASWRTF
jgi:hydrogenase maturation protein HypF